MLLEIAALLQVTGSLVHSSQDHKLMEEHSQSQFYEKLKNLTFSFDCSDKPVGFYADQDHDCQIFHMCDGEGKRVPHVCANETSFNQEFRICDWPYNFECSEAHKWYYLNGLTYATESIDDEDQEGY